MEKRAGDQARRNSCEEALFRHIGIQPSPRPSTDLYNSLNIRRRCAPPVMITPAPPRRSDVRANSLRHERGRQTSARKVTREKTKSTAFPPIQLRRASPCRFGARRDRVGSGDISRTVHTLGGTETRQREIAHDIHRCILHLHLRGDDFATKKPASCEYN